MPITLAHSQLDPHSFISSAYLPVPKGNMTQKKMRPHAFFYAVVLMGLLVVGTIVAYFLVLPRAIPKQIIVAVLPFDGPPTLSKHLTHSFPKHLTELVALSRELTVIDFDEAGAALELGDEFRGFTEELGATHIVDGNFVEDVESPGSYILTVRVVNVTQLAWKLRWDEQYHYPDESLLEIRNRAATGVLKGLYDNSVGEIPSEPDLAGSFEGFLKAQWLADSAKHQQAQEMLLGLPKLESNPYALHLLAKLDSANAAGRFEQALIASPNHYPTLIEQAKLAYRNNGDLASYLQTITELAGTYPNSEAVKELANLYHALGWYAEEEQLLFRWVKMRPRSGDAALDMAFSRFRRGDEQQYLEALRIANLRDPASVRVQRFTALYEMEVMSQEPDELNDLGFAIALFASMGMSDQASKLLEAIKDELSCDDRVEAALYIGDLDLAFQNLDCGKRFWTAPPGWWEENDPRWVAFTSDQRYTAWLEDRGFHRAVLERLEPVSIPELFAPVRRILPSGQGASKGEVEAK